MTKLFYTTAIICATALLAGGCKDNKPAKVLSPAGSSEAGMAPASDSTVYGVCGEGTSMHNLQLIADTGDTIDYFISDESAISPVKGGLMVGDRIALTAFKGAEGWQATNVINLTTLLGKWTSIDKDFEIQEGGTVKSLVQAESHPWTSWKVVNGNLVFNTDTFTVNGLGADSLYIENKQGIFVYKRTK